MICIPMVNFFDEFFRRIRRIYLTNLTKNLMNILTNFDFLVDFSLTYTLLTIASFELEYLRSCFK